MSMGLAGTAVLARIEEGKQFPGIGVDGGVPGNIVAAFPCAETGKSDVEVVFFQDVCLLFRDFCCKDEVVWDYRIFVQDQDV